MALLSQSWSPQLHKEGRLQYQRWRTAFTTLSLVTPGLCWRPNPLTGLGCSFPCTLHGSPVPIAFSTQQQDTAPLLSPS